MQDIFKKIIKDVEVELSDEFDRNFERKAFFNTSWKETTHPVSRGSLMMRSGTLRKSINSEISGDSIRWTSSVPYASIHNEGGEIVVTEKMKRFWWAMYYKATNAQMFSIKTKSLQKTKRNTKLTKEAQGYKNFALMKVGTKIKIPQRQFIGNHPQVKQSIENVFNDNLKEVETYIKSILKK